MAKRDNPFSLRFELDVENNQVIAVLRQKEADDFIEVDRRVYKASDIHPNVQPLMGLYGVSKFLQDRASDAEAGPAKLASMDEYYALAKSGVWEKERVAGSPVVSAEVEAVANLKGISVPEAQRALKKYDAETRDRILNSDKVQAEAAKIRKARESATATSLDDLA